jgi:hypothetical protein
MRNLCRLRPRSKPYAKSCFYTDKEYLPQGERSKAARGRHVSDFVGRRPAFPKPPFSAKAEKLHFVSYSLAVDPEAHRVYTPEQEAEGKPVARMVVYDAVTKP